MGIPDSIKEFLQKPNLAILATVSPSGKPQATPVWFMLDGDEILMDTSQGRVKLRNMRANPSVAVTIYDRDNPYQYVQFRGQVILDSKTGARDIDRLSIRYRGKPYQYPPTDAPQKRVSVRLRAEKVNSMGFKS